MSPCVSYVAISGTQLCTERAGSDEETSRGAAALGQAAFDFHPVRPLSEHFDSLDQLRDAVLAANSTTSSLRFHPSGDAPIADILCLGGAVVPRDQRDTRASSAVLLRCDKLLYAAALALHRRTQQQLLTFWCEDAHPLAQLWRDIQMRETRRHPRSQVVPQGAVAVHGECVGISQSPSRKVYCTAATEQNVAFVALVRASLPQEHADFKFSTIQINRGLRPLVHRDSANLGHSLTIGLGPYVGGSLWQALVDEPVDAVTQVATYKPWQWTVMSGSSLHACTPFAGERSSLVLFSHEALLRPVPPDVSAKASMLRLDLVPSVSAEEFAAQGTRDKAKSSEWRFDAARCLVAEAAIEVASTSFNFLVSQVRNGDPNRHAAASAVPFSYLLLFIIACQAALAGAHGDVPGSPVATLGDPLLAAALGGQRCVGAPRWFDERAADDLWRPCMRASWPRHGSIVRARRRGVGAFLQVAHQRAAADHWVRVRSAGTVDHSLCTNSRCDVPKGLGWSSADVLGGGYAVVGAGALCVCVLVVLFLQQLDQRRIGSSARHAEARLRAS